MSIEAFRFVLMNYFALSSALRWNRAPPSEQCGERSNLSEIYMPRVGDLNLEIPAYEFAMQSQGFNTALARLPASVVQQLHPESVYVQADKLSNNQCEAACMNQSELMTHKGYATAISILSSNLTRLLGPYVLHEGEDMRLLVVGNKILADYHFSGSTWAVQELNLKVDMKTSQFYANLAPFGLTSSSSHESKQHKSSPTYKAQNIALIDQDDTLYGIWWMGETSVKDSRIIQKHHTEEKHSFSKNIKSHIKSNPPERSKMHNSIHPLYIPEWNKYLGAVHFSNATSGSHGFKFHSEYFQYFIILDAHAPFRLNRRTKPFCFPSAADHDKCEIIQYIGGMIRDPRNPDNLLISLGINDCKSAYVRIPLATILRHMETVDTAEAPYINYLKFPNL